MKVSPRDFMILRNLSGRLIYDENDFSFRPFVHLITTELDLVSMERLIFGGISGYYGGIIDNIIQRFIEALRSFPQIPLWMALSVVIPPEFSPVMVYMGITIILSFWLDFSGAPGKGESTGNQK